jgi:hypothetical protein
MRSEDTGGRGRTVGRLTAGTLVIGLLLTLVATPTGAQSTGSASSAQEATRAASNWGWGIELRQAGPGPCRNATPAPCSGFLYNYVCPPASPGQFRLVRIRTYMGAVGPNFVGFRMRAKLIEHGQPASSVAWSAPHVVNFPARQGVTERLMDIRNISPLVDDSDRWDTQVEYRFFRRNGLPDIVRVLRNEQDIDC